MIKCPNCNKRYDSSISGCPACAFSPAILDGFPAWAPALSIVGCGFKSEYFERLMPLEMNNFWFRSRNALIIWALHHYFPKLASVLEIGCGTGFVLDGIANAFPNAQLMGSEIFTSGLKCAASRVSNAQFVQMDARHIPYEKEFDVVAAFDVIEHVNEDDIVMENLFNAAKPGGGLILTVPQHQWLWSAVDEHACHVRRYDAEALHQKIQRSGFSIIRSTSFVSLLLPAMLASRLRRQGKGEFDPLDEFRIASWLNAVLERVLDIERTLIQCGLNFPVGGSRLVVAKREG